MTTVSLQFKKITPLCLILCALGCFAFSPTAQAALAPNTPDPKGVGGVFNTADGSNAMPFMSAGTANSAFGAFALFSAVSCNANTAVGAGTLDLNSADGNTAVGAAALALNTEGAGNTAVGIAALAVNAGTFSSSSANTAIGAYALTATTGALFNTAVGAYALTANTTGGGNTAVGGSSNPFQSATSAALGKNTTGDSNTGIGQGALNSNTTGSDNVALGVDAGSNLDTGNSNVDIGANVEGVAGESGTIRIGNQGTQTATYIAGISGTAVVGDTVVVDANGQLGTATSSARFKKNIKPMEKTSEAILALNPVAFQYKSDSEGKPQFGLIAEEVAKVNPDLVVRDRNGEIYSVRYEAVNAMLLNEFLKEHCKVEAMQAGFAQQQRDFQAVVAHQQKQIESLNASLQKVSAQLEVSKAAPQTVLNGQ